MKRILGLLCVLLCLVYITTALADDTRTSGTYTYKMKGNGTISIVDFDWKSNRGDIYIPSMLDGYQVTSVEDEAFANGKEESTEEVLLVLPNTITVIGEKAFFNSPISTVSLPASVQAIGDGAFAYCAITQFIVDPGQPNYAVIDGALYHKKTRTLIAYPQNSPSIEPIPEGIVAIGDYAVCGVNIGGYESLSNSGKTVAFNQFLPSTINKIGKHAFEKCKLYYFSVSGNRSVATQYSFNSTFSLLPESVVEIDEYAFANCEFMNGGYMKAKEITIAPNLAVVKEGAFQNCRWHDGVALQVYLNSGNPMKSVGAHAFADAVQYTYDRQGGNVQFVLPNHIGTIGEYAFAKTHTVNAEKLSGANQIGTGAFQNTVVYTECDIDPQILTVSCGDGRVANETYMYIYRNGINTISEVYIEEGVEEIGISAFEGMPNLKTVTLPESLCTIEERAFANCPKLSEVTIPVDVEQIGDDAFDRALVTLHVERGSYAELWASENGYNYRFVNEESLDLDWLTGED